MMRGGFWLWWGRGVAWNEKPQDYHDDDEDQSVKPKDHPKEGHLYHHLLFIEYFIMAFVQLVIA